MRQHVSSLHISVVSDNEAAWWSISLVKGLQNLDSLAAGCSTHVDAFVLWLDVEKSHGNHGNLLLPKYTTIFSLINQIAVELFEGRCLPHFHSTDFIETVSQSIRVPLDRFRMLTSHARVVFDGLNVLL